MKRLGLLVGIAVCFSCAAQSLRAGADEPLLRFGVVSDIHVTAADDGTLKRSDNLDLFLGALRYFDQMKADAVVVAGDMANDGRVAELLAVGKAWDSVFPGDKGSDGRAVEKVFVYGNHDPARWERINTHGERLIADDLAGSWEKAFHEPFSPAYVKTVKGYDFVGVHWGNEGKPVAVEAIDRAGKTGKVFFHVQHPHVKGTVYGGNVWGQDNGASFAALSRYPQAISFSGHSHTPLENEQSIWQGAFTAIGTSSLCYISISSYRSTQFPRGYENGSAARGGKGDAGAKVMASEVYHTDLHQGLFVSVYADRIVFSRREFGAGVPIGEDWVLPLGTGTRPFDLETRRKASAPPEFPAGATLAVSRVQAKPVGGKQGEKVDAWELQFPAAKGAYEYEITGTGPDGQPVVSWVYATKSKVRLAASRFAVDNVRFSVVPVDSLGRRGRALTGACVSAREMR